mgnify:FL=1
MLGSSSGMGRYVDTQLVGRMGYRMVGRMVGNHVGGMHLACNVTEDQCFEQEANIGAEPSDCTLPYDLFYH